MGFVVVGLSHKTAPVEVREQAFIPPTGVGECVRRLVDRELIESGVLLSTCNRTELYAMAAAPDAPNRLIDSFGLWPHQLPFGAWRRYAYGLSDEEALRHVFRVASGLESMIVGEAQVLGQVKDALTTARHEGVVDTELEIILQGAMRAGKRIRHDTELGRRPVSVSHAAVASAREFLGSLAGRGVLLVGTGSMTRVAVRLLQKQRIGPLYVCSRTMERADRAARLLGGRPVTLDGIVNVIDGVDIILSSTNAPHHLFDVDLVEELQSRRGQGPLVIIDIAVPRDVDPDVATIAGVHLLNIDDLQVLAESNREERKAFIPAAERIIDREVQVTRRALDTRQSAEAVTALVRKAEGMRDSVLARQLAKVPEDDERTRAALRELADALTAKFLHGPIRALRESRDEAEKAAILERAFNVDPEQR
jgi:glutamyl-tRNA reductase